MSQATAVIYTFLLHKKTEVRLYTMQCGFFVLSSRKRIAFGFVCLRLVLYMTAFEININGYAE